MVVKTNTNRWQRQHKHRRSTNGWQGQNKHKPKIKTEKKIEHKYKTNTKQIQTDDKGRGNQTDDKDRINTNIWMNAFLFVYNIQKGMTCLGIDHRLFHMSLKMKTYIEYEREQNIYKLRKRGGGGGGWCINIFIFKYIFIYFCISQNMCLKSSIHKS